MPDTIPSGWVTEKNLLTSVSPWWILLEVQVDASNALRIVAGGDSQITFDSSTWYPYPVEVGGIIDRADGALTGIEVSVSNIGLLVMPYLMDRTLMGKTLKVMLVHNDYLADPTHKKEKEYRILQVDADTKIARFQVGALGGTQSTFPGPRYLRSDCRYLWSYGDPVGLCGYDTSRPGSLATCDGTETGANGCEVHGVNEALFGFEKLHPLRWGGCPGILRGAIVRQ